MNIGAMQAAVAARGPRYAVSATIRPGEKKVSYCLTGDIAEQRRNELEAEGHYNVRVHQPDGSADLSALGNDLTTARVALAEATEVARAAVLRAVEADPTRSEAEMARTVRVDRMTIRSWLGK